MTQKATYAAPTFAVNDANAQIAARYFEGNRPGMAWCDFGTRKSVFFGGLEISAVAFNALAKQAGAWVAAPVRTNCLFEMTIFPR